MIRAWTGCDHWNRRVRRVAHIGGLRDDIAGDLILSASPDETVPQRLRVWERVIFISMGVVLAMLLLLAWLLVLPHPAWAHDRNRPELDNWYRSLQSGKGPCCGGPTVDDPTGDATSLDGPQWRTVDGTYEVFVEGEWVRVPQSAIVQIPNVDGRALVWIYHYDGHPRIRCFMPGTLS